MKKPLQIFDPKVQGIKFLGCHFRPVDEIWSENSPIELRSYYNRVLRRYKSKLNYNSTLGIIGFVLPIISFLTIFFHLSHQYLKKRQVYNLKKHYYIRVMEYVGYGEYESVVELIVIGLNVGKEEDMIGLNLKQRYVFFNIDEMLAVILTKNNL